MSARPPRIWYGVIVSVTAEAMLVVFSVLGLWFIFRRYKGMRRWVAVSATLHVVLLLLGLVFGLPRPLKEPEEQAIAVEVVAEPQVAQGERPAPVPGPPNVTQPAKPEPLGEKVAANIPSPPPPPPPPPPAPPPPPPPPPPPGPRPRTPSPAPAPTDAPGAGGEAKAAPRAAARDGAD